VNLKTANLREMLYWMEERQRIYLKRQAHEPWPWTQDKILQTYRFCNVYREQDKETVWLREHWLQPYADHPNLWFAAPLFRQINWSPTLEEIGFPADKWNPRRVKRIMEARKARGEKTYTSAYMLPSHRKGIDKGGQSKVDYSVDLVLTPLWQAITSGKECLPWAQLARPCSLEEAHKWLRGFFGFGPFISYEVVTDWRHTRYLEWAPDIQDWANPGPGAKRGICRLLGVPLKTPLPRLRQLDYMLQVCGWMQAARDMQILPALEMRDIEHSLCEYDKYKRVQERHASGHRGGLEHFQRPLSTLLGAEES
jgi:hypothetical protein